ncbi:MAG TPA: hypothetical protein VFS20_09645 [Longimicrobium sp.]|nr:hypothetical protein [Longimicrobium sp.]
MHTRNFAVAGSALLACLLLAACGGGGDQKGAATQATASTDSACTAPASWFPTVQQPVNFQVDNTNCNFHQWAWQEFLWLMQSSGNGGQANFLALANPNDLFVANPLPYPGRAANANAATALDFMPRDVKDEDLQDPTSIHQAGDNGVLIDQAGQPVFYSIVIDSVWYNFARSNGFNTDSGFRAAPDTLNFPTSGIGALEVKTAWRVAVVGDSTHIANASSRFFTTQALIPTVTIVNDTFITDTTKMRPATLALVGMHVVGTVPGHPEFIWATFEQVDNAPLCSATPQGATNDSTGGAWSLYTPNLQCTTGTCNVKSAQTSFAPTPVCRVAAYGDTSTSSPNAQNIQSLNASVQSQLASNSILRNYRLIGGQWTFPGGLPVTFGDSTNIRGSSLLANLTMESFLQPSASGGGATCFNCHNGGNARNPKKIEVSHVWPLSFTQHSTGQTTAPAAGQTQGGRR